MPTETQYLAGGGNISIPNGITGLQFIATNGTTDYGPLLVFSAGAVESIRADITARDQWGGPGFVTNVLRNAGCAGQWALSQVNQDLYWRDMQGGIRSLYAAGSDENSAGSAPISREVSRLTDFDSWQLLPACSSIYFDNRLLVTSSPFLNAVGGVSWRDLISLDFAPYSVLQGKSTPAYDGQWSGLNITHMFTGAFMGRQRAFAIVHHDSGTNALWEIMPQMAQERDDELITCSSAGPAVQTSPIQSYLETSARPFGNPRIRKILDRFDVYLSEIDGPVELKVWWRKDNGAKWNLWDDTMAVNAQTTDPSTATPHVWQNLVRQARSQIKTYTIPSNKYGPDGYALQSGFEFQFRAAWTGRCKIYKIAAFAHAVPGGIYARRDLVSPAPLMEDATGNEITYSLDVNFGFDGRLVTVLTEPVSVTIGEGLNTSFATTASGTLPISYQWQVSTDSGATWNNVTDTGPYSGAATPTLVVTGAAFSLYGFKYRCEMKNNWSDYGCSGGTSAVTSSALSMPTGSATCVSTPCV